LPRHDIEEEQRKKRRAHALRRRKQERGIELGTRIPSTKMFNEMNWKEDKNDNILYKEYLANIISRDIRKWREWA